MDLIDMGVAEEAREMGQILAGLLVINEALGILVGAHFVNIRRLKVALHILGLIRVRVRVKCRVGLELELRLGMKVPHSL